MSARAAGVPTVFVVDDDEWVHEALTMALEAEGYRVIGAHDGLEALEQLEEHRPKLILLDWMMPRLDGPGFAQALAQRGLRPAVPIIVLTADGNARQKAEQVGAEAVLRKPFDLLELLATVERILRH
jgi:two-component system response regulator MprA